MSKVALVKCDSYYPNIVKSALEKGLELIGGLNNFLQAEDNILLKPNLLAAVKPERAVTTHPEIFRAIALILQENKFKPAYGDSPGVISFRNASIKTGLSQVAHELNIEEADFSKSVSRKYPKGIQNRSFEVCAALDNYNKVISLPKFKTHDLTRITCAVKNQYGFISFRQKREFHAVLRNRQNFARMLLDLNAFINPCLYIADAVQAMDGSGPMNGNPFQLGLIAISTDPIALDATLCRIINLDPYLVPTIYFGEKLGYGIAKSNNIQLVGNTLEEFTNSDFRVNRKRHINVENGGILNSVFNALSKIPVVNEDKCVKCGDCVNACPTQPKSISFLSDKKENAPQINYTTCIQCYCCSETCTHSAISLRTKGLKGFLSK